MDLLKIQFSCTDESSQEQKDTLWLEKFEFE